MPLIQELNRAQIDKCLTEAICRHVPVSLTCYIGGAWYNLRTGIIKQSSEWLWITYPNGNGSPLPEMTKGMVLGLAFKLGHHKHIFSTRIEADCRIQPEEGQKVHAVCVPTPAKMQRVQRRAYYRVEVPRNRSVLASFWLGGQEGDKSLKWEGWVTNISAGGFQVRMSSRAAPQLSAGDIVGVRIEVGQEFESVLADAQFRNFLNDPASDDGVVRLGFQFLGLNESPRGRRTLYRVGRIVRGFQRVQSRRRAGGAA